MELFWRRGYEGASIAELTEAMGINPPSLYACFGSKEALFRAALDHYQAGTGGFMAEALAAPNLREGIEALLLGAAASMTAKDCPAGCLLMQGGLATGETGAPMRDELADRRRAGQEALLQRVSQAAQAGSLPPGTDPAALAMLLGAMLRGMAVAAADGADRAALEGMARLALAHLPLGGG
jgi:AcrR family transcriptional regulator